MKTKSNKLNKKQIIFLVIITIILGIFLYFISTEITKSIIDRKTIKEKIDKDNFESLIELDSIDNISLKSLINNYNSIKNNNNFINYNDIYNNEIIINDCKLKFILKDENLTFTVINFNKKDNNSKELISNMIIANNGNIDLDSTNMIYNKTFDTLGTTTDETSKTSEFFQYSGLEFSLKEYSNNDYKYSFRIGRIT